MSCLGHEIMGCIFRSLSGARALVTWNCWRHFSPCRVSPPWVVTGPSFRVSMQSTLNSPYELKPGEPALVKSMSGAPAKWHRARVNNIQSIEYGTVAIQFIDYGTNEVVHFSQVRCADTVSSCCCRLSGGTGVWGVSGWNFGTRWLSRVVETVGAESLYWIWQSWGSHFLETFYLMAMCLLGLY